MNFWTFYGILFFFFYIYNSAVNNTAILESLKNYTELFLNAYLWYSSILA